MLRNDGDRPHRLTVLAIRNAILNGGFTVLSPSRKGDIAVLDEAHEAYIKAKTLWSTNNTDNTMIALIGSWARLTRIMHELDDRYGERR